MIVRLLLWRLDAAGAALEDVLDRLDELEPLEPPSTWLVNEPGERVGALLVAEDDETPPQVAELRTTIGREPDLYEEFDAWGREGGGWT